MCGSAGEGWLTDATREFPSGSFEIKELLAGAFRRRVSGSVRPGWPRPSPITLRDSPSVHSPGRRRIRRPRHNTISETMDTFFMCRRRPHGCQPPSALVTPITPITTLAGDPSRRATLTAHDSSPCLRASPDKKAGDGSSAIARNRSGSALGCRGNDVASHSGIVFMHVACQHPSLPQ